MCENDEFSFDRANGEISHKWDLRKDRGAAYAYYAIANFTGGGRAFVVLSKAEVNKYRARSSAPNSPAWRDDYDAMAKKTCIRRLEPYLPKSTELSRAFVLDGSISTALTAEQATTEEPDYIDVEVIHDDVNSETGEIEDTRAEDGALFESEKK